MSKREKILNGVVEITFAQYPDSEIYLYGSRARGDSKIMSDWDLLILLDTANVSFEQETSLLNDIYDIELEAGEIISPLIYSKSDWNENHYFTPLFENIQKEGVRIV